MYRSNDRARFLKVARREVGVREGYRWRLGRKIWTNKVKYNDAKAARHGNRHLFDAWCHNFVSWCAIQAGVGNIIPDTSWCPDGLAYFYERNAVYRTPLPGDIVYFRRGKRVPHVGIVYAVKDNGRRIVTIEGNTNTSGSAQGNGVYMLNRRVTPALRFGRPDWAHSAGRISPKWDGKSFPGRAAFDIGSRHPAVVALGKRLVAHGYGRFYKVGPGVPMGQADVNACRAFQQAQGWSGSDADGVPGPETWRRLMANPKGRRKTARRAAKRVKRGQPTVSLARLRSAFKRDPYGKQGSVTYSKVKIVERALQREGLLAAKWVDGHAGTKTKRAYKLLQKKYGFSGRDADGIPGMYTLRKLGARHGFKVRK